VFTTAYVARPQATDKSEVPKLLGAIPDERWGWVIGNGVFIDDKTRTLIADSGSRVENGSQRVRSWSAGRPLFAPPREQALRLTPTRG